MFKIRIDFGAEKPLVLMLEKEQYAEKMVSMITSANDTITVESGTEQI